MYKSRMKSCGHAGKYRNHGGYARKKAWKEHMMAELNTPPVNIQEKDDKYELHLFAPGYEKGDFLIALIDNDLSISTETKKDDKENWKRKEYTPTAFARQFALNEKINKEAIEAKYENGVLIVTLPKLEGFETDRQEIEVS